MSAAPTISLIERPQWYVKRFPNAGLVTAQQNLNHELQLDSDAPFRMTGVAVYVFNEAGLPVGAAGNVHVTIRFTRPDRDWIQKHLISAQQLNVYDAGAVAGAGLENPAFFAYFSPLGTNIFYPSGSAIVIDLAQIAGATDALVLVVFCGTKLFPAGQTWAPTYSAKSRKRPYIGYNLQVLGSELPALNVPLNIRPDAGFVWQYGQQTDGCAPEE